ncbi:MAG: GNAT family N-acetyltransferase [Acidobacteriota bacterium]
MVAIVKDVRATDPQFLNRVPVSGPSGAEESRPEITFTSKVGKTVQFEPLTESRLQELAGMYEEFEPKRVAQGLPPVGRERIIAWLRHLQTAGDNLIAVCEGRVIGHTMLCDMGRQTAEFAIFIHQDFRNQGIGLEFTRATLDLARARKFRRIWLSVEASNLYAIRIYRQMGFRPSGNAYPELEMEIYL